MNFEKAKENLDSLSVFFDDMLSLIEISFKEDIEFSELVLCYENQVNRIKGEEDESATFLQ